MRNESNRNNVDEWGFGGEDRAERTPEEIKRMKHGVRYSQIIQDRLKPVEKILDERRHEKQKPQQK